MMLSIAKRPLHADNRSINLPDLPDQVFAVAQIRLFIVAIGFDEMLGTLSGFVSQDLAQTELFAGIAREGLVDAFRRGRVRQHARKVTIFRQAAAAKRAHLLLRGRVRIEQCDRNGERLLVRFIGAGQTFGTLALFTDHCYPADAVTVSDCLEISWTEKEFLKLVQNYPRIALNLVEIIGSRLRETEERLREVGTQRVGRRIAHVLLRLARPDRGANGTAIDFPLSRKEISEMCGASLHSVSRTLAAWEKAGLLVTNHQYLTILDISELRRRAQAS